MKIPLSLKIGAHIYKIEFQDGPMVDLAGRANGEESVIYINKRFMESKQVSILFHEVIHALDWQHEWKLTEAQTSSIAEGMYQVLKDNKLLK